MQVTQYIIKDSNNCYLKERYIIYNANSNYKVGINI